MHFAGGYVLHAAGEPPHPPTDEVAALFAGWREARFGRYLLRFDDTWDVTQAASGDAEILLLGFATDVERPEESQQATVARLADGLATSRGEFYRRLDLLAGAHIVLLREGDRYEALQDATGMERLTYDRTPGLPTLVASHPALIAALRGYEVSQMAAGWMANPLRARGGMYFPGVATAFAQVLQLSPNTLLELDARAVRRFWPREPIAEVPLDEIVATVATYLRNQWIWLIQRHDVTVSLTAGADSRLTLASTRDVAPRVHFHTYWNPATASLVKDREVAQQLANRLGLRLSTFPLAPAPPGAPGGVSAVGHSLRRNLPPGCLHVRSNVLETVRGFYLRNQVNLPDRFTAHKLSRLFRAGVAEEFEPYFAEFMDIASFTPEAKLNVHYTDLFYWEHRMGSWHAGIVQGQKAINPTHVLYNCRRLLEIMLGRPLPERVKALAIWALVQELWPEALEVPVVSHAAPAAAPAPAL